MSADRLFLSPPHMGGTEQELVEQVFASNWIAPIGPMVDRFEEQLAAETGMAHVAALSSGTAALHLALRLSGIGQGDEVWGSTMTFIGGVAPIEYLGARPVFLDIDFETMLIDLDLLEGELARAEGKGMIPKVVITTDLYGHVVDPVRVDALRQRFGFIWISDTAEALGSRFGNVHAGHGADFVILSFNGNKIITTSGGGALASNNEEMIARARFLSTQARDPAPHYEHSVYGYNYRLSNVCAAIGVGQMAVLATRVEQRRRINMRYREMLPLAGIAFSPEPTPMHANRWLTTIIIDPVLSGFTREEARLALEGVNIEARPLWKPMHRQPVFHGARAIGGEQADRAFDLGLCLPSGSAMTDADVAHVVEVLLGLYASR